MARSHSVSSQCAQTRSQRRWHRCFTLLELLVVVAIIALLISILMPSLAAARDSSKRAVCMANLHSIGLGLHAYGMENRQFIPSYDMIGRLSFRIAFRKKLTMPTPGGGNTLSPYGEMYGINTALHTGTMVRILQNGLPVIDDPPAPKYCPADSKVWMCPSNPGPADTPEFRSYGNTYAYFCNKGNVDPNAPNDFSQASKVYNLDNLINDVKLRRIFWKVPLLWDNYNTYPGKPSFVPNEYQTSGFTVKAENQQRPHAGRGISAKKGISGCWIGFYPDGHAQMNGWNNP